MSKQYYTIADANRLLPQIRTQIAELKNSREEIAIKRLKMERLRRDLGETEHSDQFFVEEAQIEFSLLTARQQIDHLLSQSIEVKDIDSGLVDFLTLIDGREAYLCWRVGEPEIRYWHGVSEGFAGRRRFGEES